MEGASVGLTLVTATLPSRSEFLLEMLRSVTEQTIRPDAHVIAYEDGAGFVSTINRAVSMVETDYFCLVDDDDLLYRDHVETLKSNLTADVVWTWCDVEGRDWNPNSGYVPGLLASTNYIPSNHAFRTELFRDLGGYRTVAGWEDHDLLKRAEEQGATFLNVPLVTWRYRFHGGNMSR
jgi:glycosyltransferase involved in cell wall biosynthesis